MNTSPKTAKVLVIFIPIVIIVAASIIVINNFSGKLKFSKQTHNNKIIELKKDAILSDEKRFNEIMIDFYSMADMAKSVLPVDTALAQREKSMSDLKNVGLYYWNRNLEILDSAKKFSNSAEIDRKIIVYKEYCKMHISCYELMYKAIDKHTRAFDKEIYKKLSLIDQKTQEISGE
ncbi:hypothetical protein [Pedobacter sp.]